MSKIIIRPFETRDYEKVLAVAIQLLQTKLGPFNGYDEEENKEILADLGFLASIPYPGYYVAELNEEVVGVMELQYKSMTKVSERRISLLKAFAKYGFFKILRSYWVGSMMHHKCTHDECYVGHIVVSKEARGLKLGTKLLSEGESFAKEKGFSKYTLAVLSSNRALNLYESLGFAITKTHDLPKSFRRKLKTEKVYEMTKMI